MITKTQMTDMLSLQDMMNQKVNPDWRTQGFQWYRAIWTECAELLDHYGWKWWKKQTPDIEQIKLEIVDIWHFGMSIFLLDNEDHPALAENIIGQWNTTPGSTKADFRDTVEALACNALQTRSLSIPLFAQLMHLADMSPDELYRQYVGKNVLNFFRQDHGYQDGTYIKVWNGKEDNEILAQIIQTLDSNSTSYRDDVYKALQQHYPE